MILDFVPALLVTGDYLLLKGSVRVNVDLLGESIAKFLLE